MCFSLKRFRPIFFLIKLCIVVFTMDLLVGKYTLTTYFRFSINWFITKNFSFIIIIKTTSIGIWVLLEVQQHSLPTQRRAQIWIFYIQSKGKFATGLETFWISYRKVHLLVLKSVSINSLVEDGIAQHTTQQTCLAT